MQTTIIGTSRLLLPPPMYCCKSSMGVCNTCELLAPLSESGKVDLEGSVVGGGWGWAAVEGEVRRG